MQANEYAKAVTGRIESFWAKQPPVTTAMNIWPQGAEASHLMVGAETPLVNGTVQVFSWDLFNPREWDDTVDAYNKDGLAGHWASMTQNRGFRLSKISEKIFMRRVFMDFVCLQNVPPQMLSMLNVDGAAGVYVAKGGESGLDCNVVMASKRFWKRAPEIDVSVLTAEEFGVKGADATVAYGFEPNLPGMVRIAVASVYLRAGQTHLLAAGLRRIVDMGLPYDVVVAGNFGASTLLPSDDCVHGDHITTHLNIEGVLFLNHRENEFGKPFTHIRERDKVKGGDLRLMFDVFDHVVLIRAKK